MKDITSELRQLIVQRRFVPSPTEPGGDNFFFAIKQKQQLIGMTQYQNLLTKENFLKTFMSGTAVNIVIRDAQGNRIGSRGGSWEKLGQQTYNPSESRRVVVLLSPVPNGGAVSVWLIYCANVGDPKGKWTRVAAYDWLPSQNKFDW